jgi:SAM-dependent methyltransferase
VIVRVLALAALVAMPLALRRGLVVRAIRALDRHGGLASRRGERAYAGAAGMFAGLYRHVALDAQRLLGMSDADLVDIGSGPGDLLIELGRLVPRARSTGVEPSAAMRSISASRGVRALDGRAERLPLTDGSVDLVLSTLSAHHWDDAVAAFAEIRRVLRVGGEARIYDVRLAGYGPGEARRAAEAAGIDPTAVRHSVLDERLFGFRPYSLITIRG